MEIAIEASERALLVAFRKASERAQSFALSLTWSGLARCEMKQNERTLGSNRSKELSEGARACLWRVSRCGTSVYVLITDLNSLMASADIVVSGDFSTGILRSLSLHRDASRAARVHAFE